jgi:hypothetical protein
MLHRRGGDVASVFSDDHHGCGPRRAWRWCVARGEDAESVLRRRPQRGSSAAPATELSDDARNWFSDDNCS